MSDLANNAHTWLNQQIEELGALRNASTRDPQFKQWRQNTLTYIQRIWPDDPQRSERFRRIPFSPPSSKHDAKTGRDFYERGCAEAIEYLQALLQSIDEHGISAPMPAEVAEDTTPDGSEEDFPLVELPGEPESEPEPEPESEPEPAIDLGNEIELEPEPQAPPPPRAEPVGPPPVPGRRAARSAPPAPAPARSAPPAPARPAQAQRPPQRPAAPNTLPVSEVAIPPVPTRAGGGRSASGPPRISVKGDAGSKRGDRDKKNPLENILSSVDPERAAEPPPKSTKKGGKKNGNKQRLKDMLGFAELESRAQAEPDEPAPPQAPARPAQAQRPPQRPQKPAARGPRRAEDAGRMAMPEFMLPEEDGPESSAREEYDPTELEHTPPPRRGGLKRQPDLAGERGPFDDDPADDEALRGMIDEDDVERLDIEPIAEPEFAEEPLAEEAAPEEEEEPREEEEEPREDTSAAAAEFVMNSPVLSSQARPVQRGKAPLLNPLSAQTPAAAALLSLAAEVNTLGIPEGNRAWARAALVDLARQIESGQLSWEALRDAVHFLMEFPPLARRVLPLLLPFFEKAA
jgi:hypothetical protein